MKIKSLYLEGKDKYMREIIEEVKKRMAKDKIHIVKINPGEEQ